MIPLEYDAFGLQSVYECRLGLGRSRLQRTTTTGLISCNAGEHWLVSLRAGNERERWRTEMESLQSSSPRGVLI